MKVYTANEERAAEIADRGFSVAALTQLPTTDSVVTIGNFDGVHLGHRALLSAVYELSKTVAPALRRVALSFDPHPVRYFAPERAPALLTTWPRRLILMQEQHIDIVVLLPFTDKLATLSPEQFVAEVLCDRLAARHIVVGSGFVFGHRRSGTLATLEALGGTYGFDAHGVSAVQRGEGVVSSTRIRAAIRSGDVALANELLGGPFRLEGIVVTGAGRGRTIGVPTANLAPESELLPKRGVYAGYVGLPNGNAWPAVLNVGRAPTFLQDGQLKVEVHLLDFEGDLVSRRICVSLLHRLRDEQKFASADALVSTIKNDIVQARHLLTDVPQKVYCSQ
jgi:riboflavin kinase/FMN adenylyltransferase